MWRIPVPARTPQSPRPRRQRLYRAPSAPVELYDTFAQTAITGAQVTGTIPNSGTLTLSVGPSGLGTVWYPASAVVSTTTGPSDTSTCSVYVGAAGNPQSLQGTLYSSGGAGVVALAIPSITPGLSVIAVWTGGTAGALATLNVTGSAAVLTRVR